MHPLRRLSRKALRWCALGWIVLIVPCFPAGAGAPELNGVDLGSASVPVDEILPGGPPRDGIRALDLPETISAAAAPWRDEELVVGVAEAGDARAYPLSVLVWHELVNDRVGGLPVLVSYCPLCGTALVFDRRVAGRELRFGVSGLLYRSDLLMFDRETESLWSQISAEAVAGPSVAQRLTLLRSRMRSWGEWKREHPNTTVLSPETGHRRPYGNTPYGDYDRSERLMFPVARDARYHPKMRTVGLRVPGGPARAYPLDEIRKAGGRVQESFAGSEVQIRLDPDSQTFVVEAPAPLEIVEGFWFAWVAFHPETSVFVSP